MFLDGQELTTGFLLKVLALLIIAGAIFIYYLRDIKAQISPGERKGWRIFAGALVLLSIVFGFAVIGSPADQRARRYDSERVSDLQNIQWQIVNFWQQKEAIPESLVELEDPISGFSVPRDPKTGELYEYTKTGNLSFELCAVFDREVQTSNVILAQNSRAFPDSIGKGNESWQHEAGRTCFDRTIDPELYPVADPLRVR
jgi:hypothetical protein